MSTIINRLFIEFKIWIEFFVSHLPEGSFLGSWCRKMYWSNEIDHIGIRHVIQMRALIKGTSNIIIGDYFVLGIDAVIDTNNSLGVFIGNNVGIARGTYLRAANHSIDNLDIPILQSGHDCANLYYMDKNFSVIIEDDVWIGANVIVLSGSKIGKGSVISAGAVVSSEIPPYSIVVGNPGRVVANRLKRANNK
jgi:acetyltransferase-like isoleucine patch superfamily enzyme